MNTWERNPQRPEDEHEWITWFADPLQFRDARFIPGQGWTGLSVETLDGLE